MWKNILMTLFMAVMIEMPVKADEIPTAINQDGAVVLDLPNINLSDLPGIESSGGFQLPPEIIDQLGFDPSREWGEGTSIGNILQLGDLQNIGNKSLWNLNQMGGLSPKNTPLSSIELFQNQGLKDFVNSVPGLKNKKLNQVPVLKELIGQYEVLGPLDGEKKLKYFINKPNLTNIQIGEIDLSKYSVTSIPNLANTPLSEFKGWENTPLSSIPALEEIPLPNLFEIPFSVAGMVAMHDVTYGYKEHRFTPTKRSITGSKEVGFNYQCVQETGCAYLELVPPGTLGVIDDVSGLHGAQWIKGGKDDGGQMVPGGEGVLGEMFDGEEPTGRHPFGDLFKVVLTDTVESEGEGKFGLYFRVCLKYGFVDLGCTPYVIGPIPWFSSKEKDMIFLGL
ncbi:MAG: hypothetical protein F6K22_02390 [Okeania sp. SIO2F4]|uniref:hypothetical protein n=1 Tax=Okeania sp. SIO2F4 TaxID=2607790 RepID=UPI00142A98CE|nr:hypothetical protein [Okeania sp. SIO2F4]NES01772.1 hypothetical protein [Okeania sp. SIO2F4]